MSNCQNKLMTIVVPVRDREHIIGHTLDRIASQRRGDFALIIVDNGSTDRTAEVVGDWIDSHRADCSDVTFLTEPQPGACRARNRGLQEVATPYVMFFDSDDIMEDDHLDRILGFLEKRPETQLLHWNMSYRDADGWSSVKQSRRRDLLAEHLLHGTLTTGRFCVSTDRLRSVGGWDESLGMWNDFELGTRLLTAEPQIKAAHLPGGPSVIHVASDDSLTGATYSSRAKHHRAALAAIARHMAGDDKHTALLAARRAVLAANYRREGSKQLARDMLADALRGVTDRRLRMKLHTIYQTQRIFGSGASSLALLLLAPESWKSEGESSDNG